MTLELILILLCCLLIAFSIFLCRKIYQFSIIIIDLEDAVEDCLDLLDDKYSSMSKVLEKPIFFDSVEVRQVVSDISDCRNAILIIANKLTGNVKLEAESESKTEKEVK
jgi:hypothetical protein